MLVIWQGCIRDVGIRDSENRNYSTGSINIILSTLEWEEMVGKNISENQLCNPGTQQPSKTLDPNFGISRLKCYCNMKQRIFVFLKTTTSRGKE